MNYCKVMIAGNLTRDPELRYTAGGAAVCSFGIAVNRKYTTASGEKREDACFVDVTAWGRTGEIVAQYLGKGSPVFVEGRLHQEAWQDRQTGQNRSKLTVAAESVQFLGTMREDGDEQGHRQDHPAQRQPQERPAPQRQGMPAFQQPGEPDSLHDDIPF